MSVDAAAYRDAAEDAEALEPIRCGCARDRLLADGVAADAIDALDAAAQAEIDAAVAAADGSAVARRPPPPTPTCRPPAADRWR